MDKPNVMFIMTHDTGRYLGCYGEKVMTPNLDRIHIRAYGSIIISVQRLFAGRYEVCMC